MPFIIHIVYMRHDSDNLYSSNFTDFNKLRKFLNENLQDMSSILELTTNLLY
jgi:hypothetical protein